MDIEFRDPVLLTLLVLVLPAAYLLRPRRLGIAIASTAGFVRPRLTWRIRAARLLPALRLLAITLLVVGLARPRAGEASSALPAEGIDIVLALDLSGSMRNSTFGESGLDRLEGSRLVVKDFIESRPDDRIGLVAFQRDALPVAPPTLDHDALDAIIDDLEPGLLPDGTGLGLGLAAAINMLEESSAASRVVILLTDGRHNNDESIHPSDAAELARTLDLRVYTIGITGTSTAGPRGVDAELLEQVAETTGGRFFEAASVEDLADVYSEIGELETSGLERERFIQYREFGPWLVGGAALLLLVDLVLRSTALRRVAA